MRPPSALAAAGARVVVVDLPTSPGEQVAKELGDGCFAPADVTGEADVAAASTPRPRSAPLRVVVNCAGIGTAGRIVGKRRARSPWPTSRGSSRST